MKETIIQFGTGNFLRGFADCFVDALNKQGLYEGKIAIVSPTDSANTEKINQQKGKYNLLIRGLEDGKEVNERIEIQAVTRAVNPYQDFDAFLALASNPDFRFIISNTTEAGISFDETCALSDKPAASFPGKLTQLLYARFQKGLPGFVILACELIDHNGDELKSCVLRYAQKWALGEAFTKWVIEENDFCNTLVDRIVTGFPKEEASKIWGEAGYEDRLLDTAEPYHLWVIEGNYETELPLKKAGFHVIWTEDVAPYKKMKVRILNGAHTSLVFPSLLCGVEAVGDSLKDPQLMKYLNTCLFEYILPTLGETEENKAFAAAVLERFGNPYIRHLWKSIALNSVSKFSARVLPTITDYVDKKQELPRPLVFALAALIAYYKTEEVSDDAKAVAFIKENAVDAILANRTLWGQDLSHMTELVQESLDRIHNEGIRKGVAWSLS